MRLRIFDSAERDFKDGYRFSSRPKLLQHPQIIRKQQPDIVNLVLQQHRAVNAHSKPLFWVSIPQLRTMGKKLYKLRIEIAICITFLMIYRKLTATLQRG